MRLKTRKDTFVIEINDSRTTILPLTSTQSNALRSKHTRFKRGMEKVDSIGVAREMFIRIVQSWEGMEDEAGEPLPCTDANKNLVYENDDDYVLKIFEAIDAKSEERGELESKN